MPPYAEATLDFLRDVLSKKKRLLKNNDVKIITVPNLPELSAQQLCKMAKNDPDINKYLPLYNEHRPYSKQYLFTVINSVKQEFFPANIKDAMRRRKEKHIAKTFNEVEIDPEIFDLIVNAQHLPPSKLASHPLHH